MFHCIDEKKDEIEDVVMTRACLSGEVSLPRSRAGMRSSVKYQWPSCTCLINSYRKTMSDLLLTNDVGTKLEVVAVRCS